MGNKTFIISQYEINRLQDILDKELEKRAQLRGLSVEEIRKTQGKSATVCVPMCDYEVNRVDVDYSKL